mgnify:CR=1 FL=1
MTFGAPLTSVALLIAERSHEDMSSSSAHKGRIKYGADRHRNRKKDHAEFQIEEEEEEEEEEEAGEIDGWMGYCSIDPSISLVIYCFDSDVGYLQPALAEDMFLSTLMAIELPKLGEEIVCML